MYRLCQFQAVYALEHVRKEEQKKFEASRRKYFKRSRTLLLKHKGKLKADELETVS
ncbi:MAG: transposase, partial [Firmicutes bacterium]|nr:transposase [Bacillota bacterium]